MSCLQIFLFLNHLSNSQEGVCAVISTTAPSGFHLLSVASQKYYVYLSIGFSHGVCKSANAIMPVLCEVFRIFFFPYYFASVFIK